MGTGESWSIVYPPGCNDNVPFNRKNRSRNIRLKKGRDDKQCQRLLKCIK